MYDTAEWVTSHFHRAAPCQGRPTAETCDVRHSSFCWRNKWDPKHAARKATLWPCGTVNCWEAVLWKVPVWLMSSPELVTAGGDSSAARSVTANETRAMVLWDALGGVNGCWGDWEFCCLQSSFYPSRIIASQGYYPCGVPDAVVSYSEGSSL
jgi:hypothetical protein